MYLFNYSWQKIVSFFKRMVLGTIVCAFFIFVSWIGYVGYNIAREYVVGLFFALVLIYWIGWLVDVERV